MRRSDASRPGRRRGRSRACPCGGRRPGSWLQRGDLSALTRAQGADDRDVLASRLPGSALRAPPRHRQPLGLRRTRTDRRARRERGGCSARPPGPPQAVRRPLPDPADAARRRLRRQRLSLDRSRQTSAFNCRPATGSSRWSEHAYGRAIDVNPIENPYVSGGRTSHRASVPYLDRSRRRPGMAFQGGMLVSAFQSIGWGWGGNWSGIRDYQHFSASGRSAPRAVRGPRGGHV